jgi:acyl-homoserine-lactone acylase
MIVLDGSKSDCAWDIDPSAAQKGIFASSQLPQLSRKDFVQHSNDSAWLANPAQPLTGFSPLISQEGQPLGLRSRFALDRLASLSTKGTVAVKDLQQMVMDDQVYAARQVVPDLLKFCATELATDAAALKPVCVSLKAWDGRANLNSGMGLVHLQNIMQTLQASPDIWRVVFDPKDAQNTPRGLAIEQPAVAREVRAAMLASVELSTKMGLKPDTRWGDVQVVSSGGQQTPIHGGPGTLGIYNAIQSVPRDDGKLEVVSGTSYLQVVTFDDKGPHAQGLLAFSLSSDPASKYSRDQTQAFSKKQWSVLPFTQQQIQADPQYQVQTVREGLDKAGKVAAQ